MKYIKFITIFFIYSLNILYANEYLDNAKDMYNSHQYSKSIKYLNNHLNEIVETKDQKIISELYYGIGANYYKLGVLDSSLKYLLISENINHSGKDLKFSALLYNELSVCLNEYGIHHEALYYLKKSYSLNNELNFESGIILNLLNLGNTFYYLNNIDSSMKYYSIAKKKIKNKDSPQFFNLINSLSVIWARKGNYSKAISQLEYILNNKNLVLDSMRYYMFKTNLDMYLIAKGLPIKSLELNNHYLNFSKLNNVIKFADANFKASIYKLNNEDVKSALTYLNKANHIYLSNKNFKKATEITRYFKMVMDKLNIKSEENIENKIFEFKDLDIQKYANSLESEIYLRLSIEEEIKSLNYKLNNSYMGIKLLITLIIILCITIPLSLKYFLNRKLYLHLSNSIFIYNNALKETHDLKVKNNIRKLTNLMIFNKLFKDEDLFVETIDELIDGSNELSSFINDFNNINRNDYVNSTSTNKLRLDK